MTAHRWPRRVALALALGLAAPHVSAAIDTPTVAEPETGVVEALMFQSDGRSAEPVEICHPQAQWLRLRFKAFALHGADTLTLVSSQGDTETLGGQARNDRSFHLRALRGECVQLRANFADPASRFLVDSYQFGTRALEETSLVVAAAGDLCGSCAQTAAVVDAIRPQAVIVAGDLAYDNGTLAEFQQRYAPNWGRFKAITRPSPGNHEYNTSGAKGYYDYFNGSGQFSGPAGDRDKGYYSYDLGEWHMVALNSNLPMSANSAQERWLRADLAANTKACTLAYFHHPLFTRGGHDNATATRPLWRALHDHRADVVVVGHDHSYQRYAPQNADGVADPANGIRQFLIGTGGAQPRAFTRNMPNFERGSDTTRGVMKFTLGARGYAWQFMPVAGSTFTDSGTATCHRAPPPDGCRTPTVAASASEGTNVAANAVDGNLSTRWSALGVGSTLTLDYGREARVSGVRVAWHEGNRRRNHFTVAVSSDGSKFRQVFAGTSSGTTLEREHYTFAATAARFVRLTVNGNTLNEWASVTEYGADAECGACRFATVTASGADATTPASNVIDGNLATRWSSLGVGQWVTGDLGGSTSVSGAKIAWHLGDQRTNRFTLAVSSDGVQFREVFSGTSSGTTAQPETYAFPAVSARYLRLTVNGNSQNTWASVTEFGARTGCSEAE
ncbi:discoidin domain-containing protein [Tahibacter amnicola]|uniref:Discoidin domain-containing protein n=1 Tax=Tahibacter amnicola TaxID=2976241 RepID=A0ABY6BK51_9GAMM|nr:discoidin domain-containing protein [Tahibacter amnicola]UXI70274.1 discoidin domain-containing protein [Tahibacter amnicola]